MATTGNIASRRISQGPERQPCRLCTVLTRKAERISNQPFVHDKRHRLRVGERAEGEEEARRQHELSLHNTVRENRKILS